MTSKVSIIIFLTYQLLLSDDGADVYKKWDDAMYSLTNYVAASECGFVVCHVDPKILRPSF